MGKPIGQLPVLPFLKNAHGHTLKIWAADTEAMFGDPHGRSSRLPVQFAPACPGGPPEKGGVYAVCFRIFRTPSIEHVAYIGSSGNIHRRVMNPNHIYRRLYERSNGWLVYTRSFVTEDHLSWEKAAIRAVRPLLNIQHNHG